MARIEGLLPWRVRIRESNHPCVFVCVWVINGILRIGLGTLKQNDHIQLTRCWTLKQNKKKNHKIIRKRSLTILNIKCCNCEWKQNWDTQQQKKQQPNKINCRLIYTNERTYSNSQTEHLCNMDTFYACWIENRLADLDLDCKHIFGAAQRHRHSQ